MLDHRNNLIAYNYQNQIFRFSPPVIDTQCSTSNVMISDNPILFPNPISEGNNVDIIFSGTINEDLDIEVYNSSGQKVLQYRTITSSIETSCLRQGYYIIRAVNKSSGSIYVFPLLVL